MSQEKKEQKKGKVNIGAVIILIISALVFIPVGGYGVISMIMDSRNSQQAPVFGTYDGKEIVWEQGSDFNRKVSDLVDVYQSFGYDVNSDQQLRSRIFRTAYIQCLREMSYVKKVSSTGYSVPEKAIDRIQINNYLTNGSFDERKYQKMTDQEISTERKEINTSLMVNRYMDDIIGANPESGEYSPYGPKVSSKEAAFITEMAGTKHSFNMVYFDSANYPEEEVVKFANENSDLFVNYSLYALTFNSKEEADDVLLQINNGTMTFEDAIVTASTKLYTDQLGNLSSSYLYNIEKELLVNSEDAKALTSLAADQTSAVIETKQPYSSNSTWSIFRGNGAPVAPDFTDEATVDIVRSYINSYEISYIEDYFSKEASRFAAAAKTTSFDDAAAEFGLDNLEVPALPLNYGSTKLLASSTTLPEIGSVASDENFLTKAFALKLGEISTPIVLADSGSSKIVVLECTGLQVEDTPVLNMDANIYEYNYTGLNLAMENDPKLKDTYIDAYVQIFGISSLFGSF